MSSFKSSPIVDSKPIHQIASSNTVERYMSSELELPNENNEPISDSSTLGRFKYRHVTSLSRVGIQPAAVRDNKELAPPV